MTRYSHTRLRRADWCGALSEVILDNGQRINVICTRFRAHKTHPNVRDPLKHFDEAKKRSWYDEPQSPSLPPCSSPPE